MNHASTKHLIIHVLLTSFSNSLMMPYSMLMTGKTCLRQNKYCKRNFTLSTQPTCTERHTSNGEKRETPTKNGQIFKRHFDAEYHEICEQQRVSGESGCNIAQLAHETTDMATSLENLALAATADHSIVADLIAIKKKLVETNNALVTQVKYLVVTNVRLANRQGTKSPKPPRATITTESVPIDPNGYCWSRGFKVRMGHISIICGGKIQGHRNDTTQTFTINGKMWNKPNDWLIRQVHIVNLNIGQEVKLAHQRSPATTILTAVADTGATGLFLQHNAPHNPYNMGTPPIFVGIPNGAAMQATQ